MPTRSPSARSRRPAVQRVGDHDLRLRGIESRGDLGRERPRCVESAGVHRLLHRRNVAIDDHRRVTELGERRSRRCHRHCGLVVPPVGRRELAEQVASDAGLLCHADDVERAQRSAGVCIGVAEMALAVQQEPDVHLDDHAVSGVATPAAMLGRRAGSDRSRRPIGRDTSRSDRCC